MGYRPVNKAAREGAQTGAAAYQLVKRAPPAARASMFGVWRSDAPHAAEIVASQIVGQEEDYVGLADGLGVE